MRFQGFHHTYLFSLGNTVQVHSCTSDCIRQVVHGFGHVMANSAGDES
jgi:hypothetical protein